MRWTAPCAARSLTTAGGHRRGSTERYVLNVSGQVRGTAISFSGTDELTRVLAPAGCRPGGVTTYALQATRG